MRPNVLRVILSTCLIMRAAVSGADIDMSPEEVLQLYEQSLTSIKNKVAYNLESITTFKGAWDSESVCIRKTGMVYRDGNNLGFDFTTCSFDDTGDILRKSARKFVLNEHDVMVHNYPGANQEQGRIDIFSNAQRIRRSYHRDIGPSAVLDGHISGCNDLSIPEILREATNMRLRDTEENIDGHDTYVLEAETKYGKHTLWIDSDAGFNPRRITVQKKIGDLYGKLPIGASPPPLEGGVSSSSPWLATIKWKVEVDIQIENISGVFAPVTAKVRQYREYENGQFIEANSNVKREAIDFDPDFEAMGAFAIDAPNGTRVTYDDARAMMGVKYEWFNGKVRARVDDTFLEDLDNQIELLKNEVHDESEVITPNNTDSDHDESAASRDQKDDNRSQPDVLSESGCQITLVLISFTFLLIIVIGWQVLRKLQTRED